MAYLSVAAAQERKYIMRHHDHILSAVTLHVFCVNSKAMKAKLGEKSENPRVKASIYLYANAQTVLIVRVDKYWVPVPQKESVGSL